MYPQSMFLSKSKINVKNFILKIFNFYNLRKICIHVLHEHVFIMAFWYDVRKVSQKLKTLKK